jgi:beta-lactam-binding protein with PASTA domain
MPDFTGMTRQQANDVAGQLGLYIIHKGNPDIGPIITATAQSVPKNTEISMGSSVELTFIDTKAKD